MLKIGPDSNVKLTQGALAAVIAGAVAFGAWMTTVTMQLAGLRRDVDALAHAASINPSADTARR